MGVEDASITLAEAQSSIVELFGQIKDIKSKAAESEATVRDITSKFDEFFNFFYFPKKYFSVN